MRSGKQSARMGSFARDIRAGNKEGAATQEQVAALAEAGGDSYRASLDKLHAFNKKHRKQSTIDRIKTNWLEEGTALQRMEQKLTKELNAMVPVLMLPSTPIEGEKSQKKKNLDLIWEEGDGETLAAMSHRYMDLLTHLHTIIQSLSATSHESISLAHREAAEALTLARYTYHTDDIQITEALDLATQQANDAKRALAHALSEETFSTEESMIITCIYNTPGIDGCQVEAALLQEDLLSKYRASVEEKDRAVSEAQRTFLKNGPENPEDSAEDLLSTASTGGWDEQEHFQFMKIIKGVALAGPGGANRAKLLERLKIELPHRSINEIKEHEAWSQRLSAFQKRKKLATATHNRTINELVKFGAERAIALVEESKLAAISAFEAEEVNKRKADLHTRLDIMRVEREKRQEIYDQNIQKMETETAIAQAKEAAKRFEEQELKKAAIAFRKAEQERVEALAVARREAAAEQEEIQRVSRMSVNSERIAYRAQQATLRTERALEKAKEEEKVEEERRRIIEQIANSVPYREAILNAQANLSHITAAVAAHSEQFEHFDRARGHHPMFGFDNRKVMRDPKFRLGLALREAGLSHTSAAHTAIMARTVQPPAPF